MKTATKTSPEIPIRSFRNAKQWLDWLERNHTNSKGIWLKIAKKGAASQSLTYEEALECALCYGWIDGQKKGFDDASWLQRFTPRGPRSIWSSINREKALGLVKSGRMQPAGFAAIENARKNGQWDSAYDGQKRMQIPEDLREELNSRPKAMRFFEGLNSVNRYAILFRIQTARRPETRTRRIQQFIEMLEKGEKLYP